MDVHYDKRKLERFKENYKEKGRFDLDTQVPHLSDLAQYYEERFKSTRHWIDAIKAHALYNSCAARVDGAFWKRKAFEIQTIYWDKSVKFSYQEQKKLTIRLKTKLNSIRSHVRASLTNLDELFQEETTIDNKDDADRLSEHLCQEIPQIMSNSTERMISFFDILIAQAVKIHCIDSYSESILQRLSVAGFGSIARGEATPYSDFEFMFLVADEDVNNKSLLEKVAVTCYFLINNLGETMLYTFDIKELRDWFWDETTNGVKIDGLTKRAGHIPTGNEYMNNPHAYINTVSELIQRFKHVYNNPDFDTEIKGDLSTILSSTVHIYGNQSLLIRFQEEVSKFLPNKKRKEWTLEMLKNDIDDFDFMPDGTLTELKEMKSDIFRYPSLLLFHLKLYFNLAAKCLADSLINLENKASISKSLIQSLNVIYCAAQYIRQASYNHFGSQREDITIQLTQPTSSKGKLPWSIPRSLLTLMLMHMIPVKEQVRESVHDLQRFADPGKLSFINALCIVKFHSRDFRGYLKLMGEITSEKLDKMAMSTKSMLFKASLACYEFKMAEKILDSPLQVPENSSQIAAERYVLHSELGQALGRYHQALQYLEKALSVRRELHPTNDHPELAAVYNSMGEIYTSQGKYNQALENYNKALAVIMKICGDADHLQIATAYSNIGTVYHHQCEYKKALDVYSKALRIRINIYGDVDHPDIAASYNSIGIVHDSQNEYRKALENHNKALSIRVNISGDFYDSYVATSYNNIGHFYSRQGEHKKAMQNYKKALSISINIYGEVEHPDIATSYNNIGGTYDCQGECSKALEFYNKALGINLHVYGDIDHPNIALSYHNIGSAYEDQGEYIKALKNYNKALSMRMNVYGVANHPHIALSYSKIGGAYRKLGNHKTALESYTQALDIKMAVYGEVDHAEIAKSYNNIGLVYDSEGEYYKALEYYQKAMSMWKNVYGDVDHLDIAASCSNIGLVYNNLREYKKALENLEKSLCIRRSVYGEIDHPDIATSYNNIGIVYDNQGEYQRALENYEKHLRMKIKIHGSVNHADIAASYISIGLVYENHGQHSKALDNYRKALSVKMNIYGNSIHPDIATSYYSIGSAYDNLGEHTEALETYNKALSMWRNSYGDIDHSDIATTYNNIGLVYYNQGEYHKALENFNKALTMYLSINYDENYIAVIRRNIKGLEAAMNQ